MRDGIAIAKRGLPAVALVTNDFWPQGDFVANSLGMPEIPRVRLPHPVAGTGAASITQIAQQTAPRVVAALLGETAGTRHVNPPLLSAVDEAAALEKLHALGCTDGLPVVVPTRERVDRMVLASGQAGDLVLGTMGPGGGIASVELLATAAVMAGCLTDHMPLVMAAAKAVIDPRFDLTEMQATTHCTAPLVIVNGPVRESLGVACSFGALGPGHRTNATVGRALRLAMLNIGGARPGEADMALLGHPGKFTYCLGEDEAVSPFEPLHVSLGFNHDDSVVTVIGAEAPHSVLYSPVGEPERDAASLTEMLAIGLANLATNNAVLTGGAAVVILNPEHAAVYKGAKLDRRAIQEALFSRCSTPVETFAAHAGGFAGRADKGEDVAAFSSPEDFIILVAGGAGLYSMVMPTWCAGAHKNRAVSMLVEADQFCEVPWLAARATASSPA